MHFAVLQRIAQARNQPRGTVFDFLMKRTLLLLAAAALALSLLVAAPALSLRPYRPAAVDFELAPTSAGVHTAASGAVTSAPLRAPKRFNVVGMRWRGSARPDVRVRARSAGGHWSRWGALDPDGDHAPDPGTGEQTRAGVVTAPAWAGQADFIQYRLSRRVPGLRIHFVNSTGTATAADRAKTGVRQFVSRGLIAAARLLPVGGAHAAEARPAMVSRADWGAADCPPRAAPSYGQVRAIFVHHTVTLNDYTPDEAKAAVLGICRYHRNSNGWNDIGYNFLVDKYGTLYEGRAGGVDRAVIGAHTQGFNAQATAVSNIGDYSSVPQTQVALQAMARLIRWKLPLHGQPTAGSVVLTSAGGASNRWSAGTRVTLNRISGHRDGDSTACPGNALYAQLPALRGMVGNVLPSPDANARTSLVASVPAVALVPRPTRMTGTLIAGTGAPVDGAPVEIQSRVNGVWKWVAGTTTNSDGAFSAVVSATKRQVLRARFAGDGTLRSSASSVSVVLARPQVTIAAPLGTMGLNQAFRLRGTIAPTKPRVVIILRRKSGRYYGPPSYIRVYPRRGAFSLRLRLKKTGRYLSYARFIGDSLNVQSNSRTITFLVARHAKPATPPPGSPSGGAVAKR
ncbi:MAG: hypothetical protein QOE08_197 [Thermoleophilaceae bacterium]|nr:hypothetical protein [Thermoleophilaceae bacterium]